MAYTFLSLTNDINKRFNEVELTSSNFANATGFYSAAKDAVNAAIRDINHTHYEWPFNHVNKTLVLEVGTTRYDYEDDANTVDFDTFRIQRDDTLGNETVKLEIISYEDYLKSYVDDEYATGTGRQRVPLRVFSAPGSVFGVSPPPDKAYSLDYEYYSFPSDLSLYSDVPNIPERFKHVITDGALFYAYMFRGNEQSATLSKTKFEEGIKRMRSMLVNRYEYMRSPALNNNAAASAFGPRVL